MNFRLQEPSFIGLSSRVSTDQQLSREACIALFIHGCFQYGASMSGFFLNTYLWRLTEDLVINGIFNIIIYGMIRSHLRFEAGLPRIRTGSSRIASALR